MARWTYNTVIQERYTSLSADLIRQKPCAHTSLRHRNISLRWLLKVVHAPAEPTAETFPKEPNYCKSKGRWNTWVPELRHPLRNMIRWQKASHTCHLFFTCKINSCREAPYINKNTRSLLPSGKNRITKSILPSQGLTSQFSFQVLVHWASEFLEQHRMVCGCGLWKNCRDSISPHLSEMWNVIPN